jgi:hypothetical protein
MTETTIAHEPPASTVNQPTLSDLVDVFRTLVSEASNANMQVAVPLHQATLMLGMKDDAFTRNLIRQGRIRVRKEPGSKTTLVSVRSIRQYMGDIPKGAR